MNKSNERSLSPKEEKRSILTKLLRKLRNSPTSTEMEDLKKFKREREELKKELKELELKKQIALQKILDGLDKNFDKKLECCLKTPPLKLKDLKEQLKRERSEAESAKQREGKQTPN